MYHIIKAIKNGFGEEFLLATFNCLDTANKVLDELNSLSSELKYYIIKEEDLEQV